jgi:hypothetical protein
MGETMSYAVTMSFDRGITAEDAAGVYLNSLFESLTDLGFDEVRIDRFDNGYSLFICNARIATGIGRDHFDAAENLLDRVADLFYHDIPEG